MGVTRTNIFRCLSEVNGPFNPQEVRLSPQEVRDHPPRSPRWRLSTLTLQWVSGRWNRNRRIKNIGAPGRCLVDNSSLRGVLAGQASAVIGGAAPAGDGRHDAERSAGSTGAVVGTTCGAGRSRRTRCGVAPRLHARSDVTGGKRRLESADHRARRGRPRCSVFEVDHATATIGPRVVLGAPGSAGDGRSVAVSPAGVADVAVDPSARLGRSDRR